MAGSIPPLVSSSPPPLSAFDDDEEEDEDEFGVYAAAEDIDYNECISFQDKNNDKQSISKSRGEQDTTSQDSATDSGLCPDSEGMSPTPHSDDERIAKQKFADVPSLSSQVASNCVCENGEYNATKLNLPNGHLETEENVTLKESNDFGNFESASSPNINSKNHDLASIERLRPSLKTVQSDDFGNFEFAPSPSIISHNDVPVEVSKLKTSESNDFGDFGFASADSLELTNNHINWPEGDTTQSSITPELNKVGSFVNAFSSSAELTSHHDVTSIEKCITNTNSFEFNESNSPKLTVEENVQKQDSFEDFQECSEKESIKCDLSTKESNLESEDRLFFNSTLEEEQNSLHNLKNIAGSNFENADTKDTKSIDQPPLEEDDEFDDFTDFKANFSESIGVDLSEESDPFPEHSKTTLDPNSLTVVPEKLSQSPQEESDDEFSNFANFSSSDCTFASAQSSNSLESTSHIPIKSSDDNDLRTDSEFQDWETVFPSPPSESELVTSCSGVLLRDDDVIWSRLKTIELTHALSFQWTDSLANRCMLKSLNIDSRNILFMPWSNCGVPRFAANLSCGPLQPVKATEPLQPSLALQPQPVQSSNAQEVVLPDAHFDWGSSGLTNPLDSSHSSLLDLDFMMTLSTHLVINPKPVLNLPKTLSGEAEKILGSLTNLTFMRKNYIVFPINET